MIIAKNLTNNNYLPTEFALMNNYNSLNVEIEPTDKFLISFLELYDGYYKDDNCEWKLIEI